MIIVTLIRATVLPSASASKFQDVPYELFLLQVEGCVGVFMASVSAFRSLFASQGSHAAPQRLNFGFSARHIPGFRKSRSIDFESSDGTNGLPSIPSATMTGLRSFIRGGSKPETLRSEPAEGPDDWPLTVKKLGDAHRRNMSVGEEV